MSQVLSQEVTFNKVYPSEGKTFEHVTGMVQDRQGYMWFASKKGLYKYDGYRMTAFKNSPLNTNAISSNSLESLCTDSQGIIWIGTLGAGLERLDPTTGKFTHYRHNPAIPSSLSNDTVASLLYDYQGTLWVGTHQGLDRFDPKTNRFIHYRHDPKDPSSISNNQVRSLYEDRKKTLWVGTGSPFADNGGAAWEGGLNRLDKKTGQFTRYQHEPGNPRTLISNKVRAIFEDTKGNFWIGTAGDGLHTMNRATGEFKRHAYNHSQPGKLSRPPIQKADISFAHITFITEDATGGIWIGTADAGLSYYDPKTQKIKHYTADTGGPGEFTGSSAWAGYSSRDGTLWISNIQGDLFTIDPFLRKINHFASQSGPVGSFYQESDGTLWLASSGGLIKSDKDKRIIKRFLHNPSDPNSLSSDRLLSLYVDRKDRMWIGTQDGLNRFDKTRETFTRFKHDSNVESTISNNFIVPVLEDRQNNIWVGTMHGLNRFNEKTNSFKHYFFNRSDTTTFGTNLVTAILEDKNQALWVGAWGQNGVSQLDIDSGKFDNFLSGTNVISIYLDSDGQLWAGGEDGLYKYNPSVKTFSRFVDPSSVSGISDVLSIVEDEQKNLWIGSTYGLFRLNPQRNVTTLYGERFGINENALIYTAGYRGKDGELFFGDTSGYFAFFPKELAKVSRPPEILLTSFRIANRVIEEGENAPFSGRLWQTTEIKLAHNRNVFSFDFVTIAYSNPEANRTLYMLENYDNEWRIADKNSRAYYFNVPPGNYRFKLKSANSHGVWAEKEIDVFVARPWWQTWWAYTLFALASVGIVWGITQYRARNLIRERRILEEKVKSRTQEILKQKEEISLQRDNIEHTLDELKTTQAQLIQREKMASLGELTSGIAHEIQNPLNFVNNFSDVNKELIEEMKSILREGNHETAIALANNIAENEQKIHQHGRRADSIVKGMLLHSRSSTGTLEATDINILADEYLRLAYHGLRAKDKTFNANISTDFAKDLPLLYVVSQDIGRVLLNLYNNAFYSVAQKCRLKNGRNFEPVIKVTTGRSEDQILIKIRDNGLGVPAQIVEKIYQPFFTTKPAGQGTGLGLSISYDIIKAHHGELNLDTREGEFAEFTIVLPVSNNIRLGTFSES